MNNLNSELLAVANFKPYPFKAPSAWLGHLPFAAWITKTFKPTTFVELGSHRGHSYFSFCQAAQEAKLDVKCYAVDTWQGDEHAGNYGEDVFNDVHAHNQANYERFSHLLRMTFDEALSHFPDGSVDLLHIDGLHTYEAVKHDFDTWLPKLSPGAVVLFHDTIVRERGFGVWELWEELYKKYPNNMEFLHSHGLGVLQISGAVGEKRLDWLNPDSANKELLINYFAALGARQLERFESADLSYNLMLSRQREEDVFAKLEPVHKHNISLIDQVEKLHQHNISLINESAVKDEANQALLQSFSWRVTAPLRLISRNIPVSIKKQCKRILKALYWMLTPWNIPAKIRHIKQRDSK